MNILALETSTPVCSVALKRADGQVFSRSASGRGIHSEKTFLFVKEVTEEAGISISDLDVLLTTSGPGSYTGLRIGASAARGMLFDSDDIPTKFYALNTLAALSMNGSEGETIHCVINARRTHLYHAAFSLTSGVPVTIYEPDTRLISEIEGMLKPSKIIAGTGIQRIESQYLKEIKVFGDEEAVTALNLIRLYEAERDSGSFSWCREFDPDEFEPVYHA